MGEPVAGLGLQGDVVAVKSGRARNVLIPRKQALYATKENVALYKQDRTEEELVMAKAEEEMRVLILKLKRVKLNFSLEIGNDDDFVGPEKIRLALQKEIKYTIPL